MDVSRPRYRPASGVSTASVNSAFPGPPRHVGSSHETVADSFQRVSVREVSARETLARRVVIGMGMTRMIALLATLAVAAPASADLRPLDPPSLPSVDHIAGWVRDAVGDHPSADVRVCTGIDGQVASIQLVRSSGYEPFDRAVLKDVAKWQFDVGGEAQCAKKTITYDASPK